jgi:hypothetical protein
VRFDPRCTADQQSCFDKRSGSICEPRFSLTCMRGNKRGTPNRTVCRPTLLFDLGKLVDPFFVPISVESFSFVSF